MDANQRYSNVYNLNLYLDHHNESAEAQIAFYIPGLGSRHTGRKRLAAGVYAADLPIDVEQAYINICSNYLDPREGSEGDKIYLFGFSRGAVIACLTASLICKFGLLHPSKIQYFDVLWKRLIGASNLSDGEFETFCATNCSDGEVEFLGVYDTVLGMYGGNDEEAIKSLFLGDRLLPPKIKHACHILALDETRGMFQPVLWYGEKSGQARLEQIWMPGVHSDVGGGYENDTLSKISLYTMLNRIVAKTKLTVDDEMLEDLKRSIVRDVQQDRTKINDERTAWAWAKEKLTIYKRRTCDKEASCQFIHPICKVLSGRPIAYKSEKKRRLVSMHDFDLEYCKEPIFEI